MTPFFGLVVLAAGAIAQQPAPSDIQILRWQVEAQARERAMNRRLDHQFEKAPPALHPAAQKPRRPTKPKPVGPPRK